MTSAITQLRIPQTPGDLGELSKGGAKPQNGGWNEIVSAVSSYVAAPLNSAQSPQKSLDQLTGLLKLQMDVTRYQLRVEVVSKVAESAVASLRKLQQSQ